jgi:hypothetical protein
MSENIISHVTNKCPIVTYAYKPTQFTVFGQTYEFHQYGFGNENLFQNKQLNNPLLSSKFTDKLFIQLRLHV